jgi:hypothetical protein
VKLYLSPISRTIPCACVALDACGVVIAQSVMGIES